MKKLITSIPFCAISVCGFASIKSIDSDTLSNSKEKNLNLSSNSSGNQKGTGNNAGLNQSTQKPAQKSSKLSLVKFNTDTISSSVAKSINAINDTSLVLAEDIPMPVDENSVFENALYHKRLDSLQKQIPLNYNEYVQSYINLYAYKRRKLVERLLGEGTYYFPLIEKALKDAEVPDQMKYLTIIESQLNPFALSRVGATGLWQFMFGTGKGYGLNINSYIDERRDPLKASKAAAAYLKDSYRVYGDWLLVIASYNCGTGNVNRAIRRAGGGIKTFWEIQRYLPRETRSYVPAFIAATYIFSYAKYHGLHAQHPTFSVENDSVMISSKVGLNSMAAFLKVDPDEMRRLNPQYKRGIINASSDEPMSMVIPTEKKALFIAMRDKMQTIPEDLNVYQAGYTNYDRQITRHTLVHHKVRKGETLNSIADRYEVTVQDLKVWNHMHRLAIVPGQKLKVMKRVYGGSGSSYAAHSRSHHSHSRHIASRSRHSGLRSRHIASRSKRIGSHSKHIAAHTKGHHSHSKSIA